MHALLYTTAAIHNNNSIIIAALAVYTKTGFFDTMQKSVTHI
jgi:hypothetical protein